MSFLHQPGDLAQTPLAAILLEALNLRADGVLAVEHGGGTSRLWFRQGQPVGAQVFTGFRPLGHALLQAGKIDVDALSRSLAQMASTGRPQGEILVEMGVVSRQDVDEALGDQQAAYFGLIAALESGAFAFDATQPVPVWTRGSRLSPLHTIVDALERPQANALVVSALQPVASGGARLASGYVEVEGAFRWSPAERSLVGRLVNPVGLEVFFAPAQGVPPERARAILAALLLLGLVVPTSERPSPSGDTVAGLTLAGVAAAAEIEAALTPTSLRAVTLEATVASAASHPVAPAAPSAPAAPAASAAPAPAVVPLRRSNPAEARARRQRLLQRAMQNMGWGPVTGGHAEGTSPHAPGPAPAEAPGQATAARPSPGSAEAALRSALLEVAPRAREKNLFTRLGLPDGASREEAKKAFLAIARQFHPDRFSSPQLADLSDTVRDFFTAVNEAYEILADERKRSEYLAQLKGGSQNPARAESARVDFQKGEACIRTRDFARARGFLESAIRADPRPEYQAALAWTFVADPASKDLARARTVLAEAIRDVKCDRAQYVAGIVAREEGSEVEAERHFRAAVAANPRHADALRELKLIEGRRAVRRD